MKGVRDSSYTSTFVDGVLHVKTAFAHPVFLPHADQRAQDKQHEEEDSGQFGDGEEVHRRRCSEQIGVCAVLAWLRPPQTSQSDFCDEAADQRDDNNDAHIQSLKKRCRFYDRHQALAGARRSSASAIEPERVAGPIIGCTITLWRSRISEGLKKQCR